MRDYGKVSPQFWTGATGKKIKESGPEAVIVALYLVTSPHANMIGLYYLPKLYIAHETGLTLEGASKGLARCCEAMFCTYEEASEHVFVHAMARFQIAESLKPDDNRVKGVQTELAKAPQGALTLNFMEIYQARFNLKKVSPYEAPTKPGAGTGAGTGLKEPAAEAPVPPKVKKSSKTLLTLPEWILSLSGSEAIPENDPMYAYADSIRLPDEYIQLAWGWFKSNMEGKKQKDWRAHFRNAVKGNWPKFWWPVETGGWRLSPAGEQAKRAMESQAA